MRIYYSSNSGVTIVDSLEALNRLHGVLAKFVVSKQLTLHVVADVTGSAKPYDDLLVSLEIDKTGGPVSVRVTRQKVLKISGEPQNLNIFVSFFRFRLDEDGAHHHPDLSTTMDCMVPDGLPLVIEADTQFIEDLRKSAF